MCVLRDRLVAGRFFALSLSVEFINFTVTVITHPSIVGRYLQLGIVTGTKPCRRTSILSGRSASVRANAKSGALRSCLSH